MEGFYFYWISWCAWIFVTFILDKKNPYRFPCAFILLVTITLSIHTIEIFAIQMSLGALFLLMASYLYFFTNKQINLIYQAFGVLCITISAACFYLLALYDPVWIIFDLGLIQSICFTALALFLFRDYFTRLVSTTTGLIQGDALYSIILQQFYLDHPVGSFLFFDRLALTHIVLSGWSAFEYIQFYFHKNMPIEKEKHM